MEELFKAEPRPVNQHQVVDAGPTTKSSVDWLNEILERYKIKHSRFSKKVAVECYELFPFEDIKRKCDDKTDVARSVHTELRKIVDEAAKERKRTLRQEGKERHTDNQDVNEDNIRS